MSSSEATQEAIGKFFRNTGFAGAFLIAMALVIWALTHLASAEQVRDHAQRLTVVEKESAVTRELLIDVRSSVRRIESRVVPPAEIPPSWDSVRR